MASWAEQILQQASSEISHPLPLAVIKLSHLRGHFVVLFEKLFDVSAKFWLNLQRTYNLYEAKQGEAGKKGEDIEPIT